MREYIQAAAAFAGVAIAGVDFLVTAGTWTPLASGETLFHIGDEAPALYLVAEGLLDVLMPGAAGPETMVAQLGPGDVAGEIQMLTGGGRIATLRANTAARRIRFAKDVFERLGVDDPGFNE